MACEFVCDQCSVRAPGEPVWNGFWKPAGWYVRERFDGGSRVVDVACSQRCRDILELRHRARELAALDRRIDEMRALRGEMPLRVEMSVFDERFDATDAGRPA